ncbi:MAG: ion transporter [Verrucomicrobia bacterium]|nr:ion transporter [Verrucomicrobiota bacterium]
MGKTFDVTLIVCILLSVVSVMLASIESVMDRFDSFLTALEWTFTIAFTLEYCLRVWSVRQPWYYVRSFYGIVDLAAILPTYLSLFIVDAEYLIVVRMLRVMRVFRILKLLQYLEGSRMIMKALRASRPKITVFVIAVVVLVVIIGSLMYIIEGHEHGFSSIPMSIYWAIVTLTTVGYGDIAPITPLGKILASMVMIMGYAIIAVPTGIVTAELTRADRSTTTLSCPNCSSEAHQDGAKYCYHCGHGL